MDLIYRAPFPAISPVTHWAVMSSLRFDGTAFLAFENDLSLLEAHLLDHLFGGIASWDGSLQMWDSVINTGKKLVHLGKLTGSVSMVRMWLEKANDDNIKKMIMLKIQ